MSDTLESVTRRLDRYRTSDIHRVHGWFEDESAEVIAAMLAHQVVVEIDGGVAEIGVHHGKSFLLLANGARQADRAVALDVFALQDKNVDNSGLGDRDRFEANVAAFAPEATVEIVEASSLDVSPDEAKAVFGAVRMMSIDGGHTPGITEHDLRLAENCIVDSGVVVLDDVLNPHWLGVVSGLFRFLDSAPRLVPFAYSENKLYLAPSPDTAARYSEMLRDAFPDLLGKQDVQFHNTRIDVYGLGSPRWKATKDQEEHAAIAALAKEERTRSERRAAADSLATAERRAREAMTRAREAQIRAEKAKRRVSAMTNSTSWRVTAPLRALSTRVRRRHD